MAERENDGLRRLRQNLAKDIARDKRDQQRKTSRIEQVRKQLETQAKGFVLKYQREVDATQPDAEIAVNQVIQPWFSELISSGTYSDLTTWARSHIHGVNFSDPILFYWPDEAFKGLKRSESKPFQDDAKFMVGEYDDENIERRIQGRNITEVVWSADIYLPTSKWNKSEDITILRTPLDGKGHMWASWDRYNIIVDPNNVISSINGISPEVWVEFGKQIESGDTVRLIEQSMRSRRRRAITQVERQAEDIRMAQRYLRSRQWH